MSFNKIKNPAHKNLLEGTQNFKNTARIICKKNWNVQTDMNAIKHEEATTCIWHS